MSKNNLDFLDYLNDDGEVNLDEINSFLGEVEKVDESSEENQEDEDSEDAGSYYPNDEEDEDEVPYIDGLDFLNRKPQKAVAEESEEEQEEGEEEETEEGEEEEESGEENPFAIFAKGLAKVGRLVLDEDEDPEQIQWDEEKFIEKFDETVDNSAWSRLEELATDAMGEEGLRVIVDLFINKVPVHQYLASFQQQQSLEELDMSNERNQVELVRYYLRSVVGEDENEIADQIEYMRSNETLEKKAVNFQKKLAANEEQMRSRMAAEAQARQEQMEQFEKQRIDAYSEIAEKAVKAGDLNGLPFSNKDYERVLNSALSKEYVLPNGQKITPFEYKLATLRKDDPAKYLQIVKLVEDDVNLAPVMKKGVTDKTNEIFKGLQSKTKTSSKPRKNQNVFNKYIKQG
jgi:hypothetical protein